VTIWERAQRTAAHAKITLQHVMASSAIPLIFPAVEIDERFYGDGSVRQTAPLSPAIHLGADRLLVIGMRPGWSKNPLVTHTGYPTTAQIMALLFDSVFLDALDADAERLELVNRLLPGAPAPQAAVPLKQVKLLMLRPSRGLGDLAAGLTPRLPGSLNRIVKSIGGSGQAARDF
jgi:NTE family protein